MDSSTASQNVETSMEYMKFCAYVVDKEMQRFNLDFSVYQSFVTQLPGILDVNFDIAYNRCAFMYKYTLCNIYFFKDCLNKFILEYPEFTNLLSKWTADSNIRLCSLSCGPGLDYLSFMLALSDHLTFPSFKSVTILPKHGAWRNTVGIVTNALQEGLLSKFGIGNMVNFKNVEVVQANLLTSPIPAKGLEALKNSSVILMVKTLNLTASGTNEEEILKTKLMELISALKPETTIFCIDTKPSLTLFLEILSKFDGKFLFKPENLSFRVPVTFSEEYKERNGCLPVVSSRGAFFVWQKLSAFEPDPNFNISPINPPTDVKEISQNSLEKLSNENEEFLKITKTLDPNFNIPSINPPTDVREISQNSLEKLSNENEEVLKITKTLDPNFNISLINPPTDLKEISQNFLEKLSNENEEFLKITTTLDPNFNIPPINPPTDVKEISQNSLEKLLNENEEVLKITKTLKDLILPSSKNLQPYAMGNVFSNSPVKDNKSLQPYAAGNVFSNSPVIVNKSLQPCISDIRELVSPISSSANTPKKLKTNKSASSQNLVTSQSVQDLPQENFDVNGCFSHSLKKASSIDNSFFQGSSKNLSFLGESDLIQNSLHSSKIEETYQPNVIKKKISENKQKNASKSNQALKPTSESKATQTDLHESTTNSSPVKGLTERVKRLISSLEKEVQKNIPDGQVNCHLHESPNRSTNYPSCSTNCGNNSEADMKPQCSNDYHIKREYPVSSSNYVHCCAVRHMMHGCEMQCCQSCVHRCNINPHRAFYEGNIASTSASFVQPQIVIPLQNVSDDILLQLISSAKSGVKPQ